MIRLLLLYLVINHCVHFILTDELYDNVDELKNVPPDHVIPYSEHENPPEPPTKPKYIAPGEWARPSSSNKSINLDFIPTKLYAQVRQKYTKTRIPRKEALKHATTDEEKENAARLKEIVTNRKVNTVYTEEGYEDAAYDHGGHIRDANIDEKYSVNDHESNNSENNDNDTVTDPKIIVKNGVEKLERDLSREDKEAAKRAETEVPENLRDLTDDSSDYIDESTTNKSNSDYDYEDKSNDAQTSTKTESILKNSAETATNFELTKIPKNPQLPFDISEVSKSPVFNYFSPALKQLSSFEDESTSIDYSQVFWDYFKTQKPSNSVLPTNIPQSYEQQISMPKIELQSSASTESEINETPMYPSLSQIYESWKQRGVDKRHEGLLLDHDVNKIIETTTLASNNNSSKNDSDELSEEKIKKKHYKVMVRAPKKYNNYTNNIKYANRSKRLNNNIENYSTNNIDSVVTNNKISTTTSMTVLSPLGQVTYTNFSRDTYDNPINSTVTQESRSSVEQIIPETVSYYSVTSNIPAMVPTITPPIYRYHQQRHHHYRRHRPLTQQSRKRRKLLSLIKMLPPSPSKHSEYAKYYPQRKRRSGSVKSDHDPYPHRYKNYRSAFYDDGKKEHRRKRFSIMIDSGLDSEKVLLKGVKDNNQSIYQEKLYRSRHKRNVDELLTQAPDIVDEIIHKEIKSRFPDNQDDKNNENDNNNDNREYDDKANQKFPIKSVDNLNKDIKIDIEVPEYNFSDILHPSNNEKLTDKIEILPVTESIDNKKYPFYNEKQISRASPLKYVINPLYVPQKTHGGSEFYESRVKYMECDDIEVNLSEEMLEDEKSVPDTDIKQNPRRLSNLGDKLSCLRDKYFDKNPLDNPLFKEKRIENPDVPEELNPIALKLAFSSFIGDTEAIVPRRISKKPEIIDLRPTNTRINQISIDHDIKSKNNATIQNNHAKKYRRKYERTTPAPDVQYQKQVYEDVMGTIKNLAHMHNTRNRSPRIPHSSINIDDTNSRINYSSETLRDYEKNVQNYHNTGRLIPPLTLTVPDITWRYKIRPYKTNRVSYKTRPRIDSIPGTNIPQIIGYYKTVRIHKRNVNPSDLNIDSKSFDNNILVRNATRQKRMRRPKTTISPEISTHGSQQDVFTVNDRMKHSKPRKRMKLTDFISSNKTLNKDTKRGEVHFTPIRKFDDNIHELEYSNKKVVVNDNEKIENYPTEQESQLNTHKKIHERSTLSPIIVGYGEHKKPVQYSDDTEGSGVSEDSSSVQYRGEESQDDENLEENDKKESGNKNNDSAQIERPAESYTKTSQGSSDESNESESSRESQPYDDEEKNISRQSNGEEEFHRFVSRPLSPFDSNFDEKYWELGPRIDKPAFYHPPFDSLKSKNKSRYREQHQETSNESQQSKGISKYTFPWEQDDDDASEESKRYEKITGRHEYPWERRERIARERQRIGKDKINMSNEQDKSGTITRFKKIYPWERYDVPSRYYGTSEASNYFSPMHDFDNYGFSSKFRPIKFSSRYKLKLKPIKNNTKNKNDKKSSVYDDNYDDIISTTYASQIPATSATFSTLIKDITTPSSNINTSISTLRPKFGLLKKPKTTVQTVVLQPTRLRPYRRRKQLLEKSNDNNNSLEDIKNQNNRRASRMTKLTMTLKPSKNRKRLLKNIKTSLITPESSRNIEHRSKISKEEKITKTTFPNTNLSDVEDKKLLPKNKVVQKVSILTKETPEHIYRTEKIENDGIKDTFFSILSNNNTHISMDSDKEISMEEMNDTFFSISPNNYTQTSSPQSNKETTTDKSEKDKTDNIFFSISPTNYTIISSPQSNKTMLEIFSSISPNGNDNNTQESFENDEDISMERILIEESDDIGNITRDLPKVDLDLKLPSKAMQLSEQGTRKITSSFSWMTENFDY